MKRTFDDLCDQYLKENAVNAVTTNTSPTAPSTSAPTPQPTPPANQPQNDMKDEELFKLLQQKMADEQFKQTFAQWLKMQQQQNAA